MARRPRIEYEGAVYHITARGNERREIFRNDEDREMFLSTLEAAIDLHGIKVLGYCLMPNHYHLLLKTPRANLSRALGWLQSTYTIRFNRRHRRSGHLFQGRFKALLVDADSYAMELIRYLHLNPVRPKNKTSPISIDRWPQLERYLWSSHRFYSGADLPPKWVDITWLAYFGKTKPSARRAYQQFIKQAFETSPPDFWNEVRCGQILGDEQFAANVAEHLSDEDLKHSLSQVPTLKEEIVRQLAEEESLPWQIWLRVLHGGEKRIEVARSLGYKDGSAVTHILKRLDRQRQALPSVAAHAQSLTKKLQKISSFKD